MTSRSSETTGAVVHAPHPPLTEYYQSEEDRREWVGEQFDKTAADYDRVEKILGLGTGPWYRRKMLEVAGLKPGMRILDVGMGTGLVAKQAAAILGDASLVTGVDPSAGMIRNAKLPVGVTVIEGRAELIPLPAAGYDFLSMGYALRHVSDMSVAFAEFHRVLKPGGKVCILEITPPKGKIATALLKGYCKYAVPMLAKLVARDKDTAQLWRYYWDTIEACAVPEQVMATLESAGFVNVRRTVDVGMFSTYLAEKPQ
ncbi:MAG: class I SAM-dependent methyltransferase [Gammaproteobacteria bacterium]|nr:class I SAM-dependent methyltransferase [Gammaproteobacteria bacterium]MBU1775145.1 class I SAM-dependent methyltransferase [Gammaproteobacteria bacterium]MBU1967946.1 class I SAM-dependent methyltransferase [Gammaproteobacteria bacterium]